MSFYRFNLLNITESTHIEGNEYPALINANQIATIKPINIMFKSNIIHGYWIRLINGKKYKATRIPRDLIELLEKEDGLTTLNINNSHTIDGNMSLDNTGVQ